MNNVKSYTAKQLLDRVASLPTFTDFPEGYWNIWVRSKEDAYNVMDDKVYLFKGKEFIFVTPCTTNAGSTGLKRFESYGQTGVAVLKSDVIVYDSHARGMHKGKVLAYRQVKPWPYFRDSNKDNKIDEIGKEHNNIIYANVHPSNYTTGSAWQRVYIGGWSLACLVYAIRRSFDRMMNLTRNQKYMTNCILKEF